ncbi:ABC transporter substrate-binding protein, partial [Verminephrobacter sp. Larva24]
WARLSDEDKKVFGAVMQEAADKAGHEVLAAEARLVQEFRNKGNNVIAVDKRAFREAVLKATRPTDHGLRQRDYERILAIQ